MPKNIVWRQPAFLILMLGVHKQSGFHTTTGFLLKTHKEYNLGSPPHYGSTSVCHIYLSEIPLWNLIIVVLSKQIKFRNSHIICTLNKLSCSRKNFYYFWACLLFYPNRILSASWRCTLTLKPFHNSPLTIMQSLGLLIGSIQEYDNKTISSNLLISSN